MRVVEIFDSIQGEGSTMGQVASFLRLEGCNLQPCRWCDTKYAFAGGYEATIDRVAEQLWRPNVVITGGEPLLQCNSISLLIGELREADWSQAVPGTRRPPKRHITIETNGTIFDAGLQDVDLWSISPKLGSSGHEPNLEILISYLTTFSEGCLQFKFVIADLDDLKLTWDLIESLGIEKNTIVLQPNGMVPDPMQAFRDLVQWVVKGGTGWWQTVPGLRIMPQLHVLAWHHQRQK